LIIRERKYIEKLQLLLVTLVFVLVVSDLIVNFISIIRTIEFHQKKEIIQQEMEEFPESTVRAESVLIKTNQDTSNAIIMISKAYFLGLNGFHQEDRKQLGEIDAEIEEFNQRMGKLEANIFRIKKELKQNSKKNGQ